MAGSLVDVVLPPLCLHCGGALGKGRPGICAGCLGEIEPLPDSRCRRCDLPRPGDPGACGRCRSWPAKLEAVAATLYQGPATTVARGLKYRGWRHLAVVCAEPMAAALDARGARVELLVPVPLHSTRERERGFNQAEALANRLAPLVDRPVESALVRIRPTASQVGLGRERRRANLRGAFSTRRRLHGDAVGLVDDVATSGATLSAAAEALLEGGAGSVVGVTWALAFAPAGR